MGRDWGRGHPHRDQNGLLLEGSESFLDEEPYLLGSCPPEALSLARNDDRMPWEGAGWF